MSYRALGPTPGLVVRFSMSNRMYVIKHSILLPEELLKSGMPNALIRVWAGSVQAGPR